MNISGSLMASVEISESLADGLESGGLTLSELATLPFTAGTAASECDLKWSTSSTLAAGASETWTLSALTDGLNRAVDFARVKLILIETGATVDGDDLIIGNAPANPWAAIFGAGGQSESVKSLGVLLRAALNTTGYPVAAGSSDQLKIANASSANPITYRITFAGCSI